VLTIGPLLEGEQFDGMLSEALLRWRIARWRWGWLDEAHSRPATACGMPSGFAGFRFPP